MSLRSNVRWPPISLPSTNWGELYYIILTFCMLKLLLGVWASSRIEIMSFLLLPRTLSRSIESITACCFTLRVDGPLSKSIEVSLFYETGLFEPPPLEDLETSLWDESPRDESLAFFFPYFKDLPVPDFERLCFVAFFLVKVWAEPGKPPYIEFLSVAWIEEFL